MIWRTLGGPMGAGAEACARAAVAPGKTRPIAHNRKRVFFIIAHLRRAFERNWLQEYRKRLPILRFAQRAREILNSTTAREYAGASVLCPAAGSTDFPPATGPRRRG